MKNFLVQLSIFVILGTITIIGVYLIIDPFKVVYNYNSYDELEVPSNRDYISTELFLKNHQTQNYNSFIFGSSRTLAFKASHWKKYLSDQSHVFTFDASGENLRGIYLKLKYLDQINVNLKNALIIICRDATFINNFETDKKFRDYLFIKHWKLSNQNYFTFQYEFFKGFIQPVFLKYYFYKIKIMGDKYQGKIKTDSISNEMSLIYNETQIKKDIIKYYDEKKDVFYLRKNEKIDSMNRINSNHIKMLQEIKQILIKHKTIYKIVISPLYEQTKFNKKDYKILKDIFNENLYDFSGKNKFTENKRNYYEESHYRPIVGDSIFKEIY